VPKQWRLFVLDAKHALDKSVVPLSYSQPLHVYIIQAKKRISFDTTPYTWLNFTSPSSEADHSVQAKGHADSSPSLRKLCARTLFDRLIKVGSFHGL
jgi:hypothetical protein